MSASSGGGGSGCTRRVAWTSAFLTVLVLAFTMHLLGVLTPSWQYVYLEDGRTEHHHGLWLDCKRDYSNEYGRPREYYESLYRLNHLQSPFDQFWLPKLQCVYKFDYWLDDEDWYEHGYDENRLQGDAYQHLFIGWKIAAFTAHAFALVASLIGMVMLFCGFCHRLLVCVAAVLVTLSAISCTIGNVVFYMFASYQDNNIIREEDGIYEQYFGWSFYSSLIGNVILIVGSILGCSATTAVLSTEKTRLVKIEVDEDGAQLLRMSSTTNGAGGGVFVKNAPRHFDSATTTTLAASAYDSDADGASRFRRSRSAIYRVESGALRQWERDAMRDLTLNTSVSDFKRANSLPDVAERHTQVLGDSRQSLAWNLSNAGSIGALPISTTREFIPTRNTIALPPLPPMPERRSEDNHRRPQSRRTDNTELIYECVDEHSLPFEQDASKSGTFEPAGGWLKSIDVSQKRHSHEAKQTSATGLDDAATTTTLNTYDRVPQRGENTERDEYLKPVSVCGTAAGEIDASTTFTASITSGVPPAARSRAAAENAQQRRAFCDELRQKQSARQIAGGGEKPHEIGRNVYERELYVREEREKREFTTNFDVQNAAKSKRGRDQRPSPESSAPYLAIEEEKNGSDRSCFQINTFQQDHPSAGARQNGAFTTAKNSTANNRSLVNLVNLTGDQASTVSVFDRRDSVDFCAELDAALRSPQPLSLASSTSTRHCDKSDQRYAGDSTHRIKETNFNGTSKYLSSAVAGYYAGHSLRSRSPATDSEADRSMGSVATFRTTTNDNNSPVSSVSSVVGPWRHTAGSPSKRANTARTMI